MTSEMILEDLIEKGDYCYKKNFKKYCPQLALKLDMKKPVKIDDEIEYTCWKELTIHRMGLLLQEYCPDADITIEIDGNDSRIIVNLTEEEERKLVSTVYPLVEGWDK